MRILIWRFKMFLAKLRYPNSGYYERVCLVTGGYTKQQLDEMVEEAIKGGWIDSNSLADREDVFETEVSYWEE